MSPSTATKHSPENDRRRRAGPGRGNPTRLARSDALADPGVAGIGGASLLADIGHEVPTALLPSFLASTLGASGAALGLIEGIADGCAGIARFAGGALADDPGRRRRSAHGGYTDDIQLRQQNVERLWNQQNET